MKIQCCGTLFKPSNSYYVDVCPPFAFAKLYVLDKCPVCGHFTIIFKRTDVFGNVSEIRKRNAKAIKLFQKLKPFFIRNKFTLPYFRNNGKSYLYYNEFGKIKKCYCNLSKMHLGLFDNDKFLIHS